MAQVTAEKPPEEKILEAAMLDEALSGAEHIARLKEEIRVFEKKIEEKEKKVRAGLVPIRERWFQPIILGHSVLLASILVLCVLFIVTNREIGSTGLTLRHLGTLGLLGLAGYLWLSLGSVRVDEWGGLTFLNKPIREFRDAGPVYAPPGLFKLELEPRVQYTNVYPGPAESIVHVSADGKSSDQRTEKYSDGEVRAILVQTGPPTAREQAALQRMAQTSGTEESAVLFKQGTVEFIYWIIWCVYEQFLYNRDIPGNTPQARRAQVVNRLRQRSESELKEIISKLTPATVNQCREEIGILLGLKLREIALGWGVYIDSAGLGEMNLSHKTHQAQARAIRSSFTKITLQRKAEANKITLEKEGEGKGKAAEHLGRGNASARQAFLEAEAIGNKKIKDDLCIRDGSDVLRMNLAKEALEKAQFGMYGGKGVPDLVSLFSTAKSVPPIGRPSNPTDRPDVEQPEKVPGNTGQKEPEKPGTDPSSKQSGPITRYKDKRGPKPGQPDKKTF